MLIARSPRRVRARRRLRCKSRVLARIDARIEGRLVVTAPAARDRQAA